MPQKILLIRLRLIGDVVLTTPAVRAVRRAYPDAHVSYLVEPHASVVVANNPHIDEVIVALFIRPPSLIVPSALSSIISPSNRSVSYTHLTLPTSDLV